MLTRIINRLSSRKEQIRAFASDDIAAVIRLYNKVYRTTTLEPRGAFNEYWENVFLGCPFFDSRTPSLVCENADGQIIGFLGLMHRKCILQERSFDAVVPTNFMVDRELASPTVALKLQRACYAGAQHMTITDGYNDLSSAIAKKMGGKVVPINSLIWIKYISPIKFTLFQTVLREVFPQVTAVISSFFDRVVDAVKREPNLPRKPNLEEQQLTVEDVVENSNWIFPRDFIRPQYDRKYTEWIFHLAGQRRRYGELQKRKVLDEKGNIAGWYIYYPNPGGIAYVLQLAAPERTRGKVMDALFWSCSHAGSLAVSGQVQPSWLRIFGEHRCYLEPGPYQTICHSHNGEILDRILTGRSSLSRLDMEFPVRFNEFVQRQQVPC